MSLSMNTVVGAGCPTTRRWYGNANHVVSFWFGILLYDLPPTS